MASKWTAAAGIAVACSLSGCGGAGSKSPAAPSATTDNDFQEPATHRAPLPGGGEITLRFVAFHPGRGARLVADQGAYVSVHWEMPRQAVLVSVAGDAWDGTNPLQASFMSSNILFALPLCPSDVPVSRTDQLGRAAHPQFEFPRRGDPDVPFVRVRIWVTDWPHGCEGNMPMPPCAQIQASTPTLTAFERVAWRRP
jgi:hypothetical protein